MSLLSGCLIRVAVGGVLLVGVALAQVVMDLDVRSRDVAAEGWSARGVETQWRLGAGGLLSLTVRIASLQLPDLGETLSAIRLDCPQVDLYRGGGFECARGLASLSHPLVGGKRFSVSARYRHEGGLQVRFHDLRLGEGRLSGTVDWRAGAWSVELDGKDIPIGPVWNRYVDHTASVQGLLAFRAKLAGQEAALTRFNAQGRIHRLDFANAGQTRVGEGVGADLSGQGRYETGRWVLDSSVVLDAGQIYLQPVYLDVAQSAVHASGSVVWDPARRSFEVRSLEYRHPGILRVALSASSVSSDLEVIDGLHLDLGQARFPGVYTTYLQPLLIGSALDSLETRGSISGAVEYGSNGDRALQLNLQGVSAHDSLGRYGVQGMQGELRWHDGADPRDSRLHLKSGQIYNIAIGETDLRLTSAAGAVWLNRPARIPVLDGALLVDAFRIDDASDPMAGWRFDAALTPISMQAFTKAVGWPEMSGRLSGMIPEVSYMNQVLRVDGALLMRLFEGNVIIDELQLEQPFGVVPRLSANVVVRDIDLDALTRRFAFGNIQGTLQGHIRELEMVDWAPVHFDASLGTPPNDPLPHRISQRAVENLASIGGGPAGALSGGLLRFFENFSFDRLGLSCRLQDGICEMGGVGPAQNGGYYIVKGAGLPRIDVIGYSRRVDWGQLVERLKNVSIDQPPTIQ